MVSHIRLENTQNYKQQICLSFMTGFYGCRWKRYQRSTEPTTKFEKAWVVMLALSFAFIVIFLYYWVMAQNDIAYFNGYLYYYIGSWFDWFMLFYVLTILSLIYLGILLVLMIAHCVTGRQLYLHWVHKIPVVLVLIMCIVAVILLAELWKSEWTLVALTLQVTAPIIQFVAIVILTIVAWPFASLWWRNNKIVHRCVSLSLFIALLMFVYLSPLLMEVPCVVKTADLPVKPPIIAHRGAEQIAPENTKISFQTAANYSVFGFESDVRISWDGVPFLMHDSTLTRTTNVHEVFPNRTKHRAESFTWAELQKLDAGSWFLKSDPHNKLKYVPEETRKQFIGQKIPSYREFLELAVMYNKTVVFDLAEPPLGYPYDSDLMGLVVNITLHSGIRQDKVWWLPKGGRDWVKEKAPEFVFTAQGRYSVETLIDDDIYNVNAEYTEVNHNDIREYAEHLITTNIYIINTPGLYSIYWCVGAHTVTTSACQDLYNIKAPVWHMTPTAFLIVSVVLAIASALCIVVICVIQRCRNPVRDVNPESISLHSPLHFTGSTTKKSDRELLYRTNEDTMFNPAHTPAKDIQVLHAIEMDDLLKAGSATCKI